MTGFLVKSFEECCVSTVLTAACYWLSSQCIPAHAFVPVSGELYHDHLPLVLDSDKGVWCHRSFSQSPSVVFNLFAEGNQIQTYDFVGEPHKKFSTQFNFNTFCFIAERSLLHKILDVLLKDCWGPHKGCLGAECGPQNRGWEPLSLHELDRQSQPSRRGCHSWDLQDQAFTFCIRYVTASILSTRCSACTPSVSTASEQAGMKISTKIPSYNVSLETQGSVCCKWAAVHYSRSSKTLGWYSRVMEGGAPGGWYTDL